jgi:hypothetical protein
MLIREHTESARRCRQPANVIDEDVDATKPVIDLLRKPGDVFRSRQVRNDEFQLGISSRFGWIIRVGHDPARMNASPSHYEPVELLYQRRTRSM